MVGVMAALMLALAQAAGPEGGFSAEGRALIAAVQASLDEVKARHAALPPPKDDAERLERMGELDQAPRKVVTSFDFSKIPAAERDAVLKIAVAPMEAQDEANQQALMKMLPKEGWFLRSTYGDKAARAAFHIAQHADLEIQKVVLPRLEALVGTDELDGQNFGLMYDRVQISEDRPQRYGTQFRCDGGKWRPYPIEDEANVEARRQAVGFGWTYAQNKAAMEKQPPCPQTRRPPPPGMKLD